MNDHSEFKGVDDFIRKNKPQVPAAQAREKERIWSRIVTLSLSRKPFWTPQFVSALTISFLITVAIWSQFNRATDDFLYGNVIEQTFELEFDSEEFKEVSDLLALGE